MGREGRRKECERVATRGTLQPVTPRLQVFNVRPNMKIAVEFWEPRELPLYAVLQRHASQWVGKGAKDYISVNKGALQCAGIAPL